MFYTQSAVRDLYSPILFKSELEILIVWLNELHGKAGHFTVWANGKKQKTKILACETKVEKGVCLRRLAKFSLRSKRFQSSYCAKVVAKANLKWSGEGEGRRGNACRQTLWSFPSLPSSPLLITIFGSRPNFLNELARKRLLRRLKFKTSKFRPGIAFTISTNKLHLPKNGHEGLKLGCFTFTQTTRVEIFSTTIKL